MLTFLAASSGYALHGRRFPTRTHVLMCDDDELSANKADLIAALADGAALDDNSLATFNAVAADAPGVPGDMSNLCLPIFASPPAHLCLASCPSCLAESE